jgi:hypothetical protein
MISFFLHKFGYSKRPYLIETRFKNGALAALCKCKNDYAILYDYERYRKSHKDMDYQSNEVAALMVIAHEMRHYFQVRQLFSKTPRVNKKTLDEWRDGYYNGKDLGEDGCETLSDYFSQAMELDAELYAYVMTAKILDRVPLYRGVDYIKKLRAKYVEMFGDDDEDLYIFDEAIAVSENQDNEDE